LIQNFVDLVDANKEGFDVLVNGVAKRLPLRGPTINRVAAFVSS
jgi:hypothetical protein